MLEWMDVSVRHGSRRVLDGVSCALRPERVTVLLGRNGSGKSTMLRCVNRLQPYTGEIRLDNRDLRQLSSRERARKVGILPQLLPETPLTVRAIAAMGRNPYVDASGRLGDADRRIVDQAMRQAGVEALADRSCAALSGGERQRAFLAMLLAQDTPVLLLDEPTTYLDVDARRILRGQLAQLAHEQKKTLLVVLHDLNEAAELADDLIVLDGGRVVFSGTKETGLEQQVLERVFGVTRHECTDGSLRRSFFL